MYSFSSWFMPAIGSSRTRKLGSATSARASSTRFFRPIGIESTSSSRTLSSCRKSMISSTTARCWISSARLSQR